MADMGAQPGSVKPGVYGAEGDDWTYKVNEDGAIEVKQKDGDSWIKTRPGTTAHKAIMGQLQDGTLKPSAEEPTESKLPAWADLKGVAERAVKGYSKDSPPGGPDDLKQVAAFASKASNEPMMEAYADDGAPARGKSRWERGIPADHEPGKVTVEKD